MARMLLSKSEVIELTDLTGNRLVNHQARKRLLLDLAARHFASGSRLVDIGCAAGDLTIELQARGFQMTGIDFEPQRVARARGMAARHHLPVQFLSEDLQTIDHPEPYDGMVMGEILEHFVEPRAILEKHLPFLKPGGKILITVPNMAHLRARLKLLFFGEFADHNPQHRYYFTRRRFVEHFQPVPVEIVEISSFLVELTLIRNEAWARFERALLSPLIWPAPWLGAHLIVVVRKK